ncbi:Nuclear migration protein [Aspergillus sclerotialis]|uniref:Nuclear migration protein n=1 Tax=Aspergillus sclerotialis TaxID=2070753 RepID=A0A3A2ZK51_9EURO|nr:Nuclear migration protein [Aspergillus sclerotialis]
MATKGEYSMKHAFPTPSATPIRVSSRPSFHRRDSSPVQSSSPIIQSPSVENLSLDRDGELEDIIDDESSMAFDPRRFTPTLHASLVSEILSLRREVESKSKSIDVLEHSLADSRTENESLSKSLSRSTKEGRSLKHQLQLLEGGSSSALTELAKERDEALENISDVRKRLEQAQRKTRNCEEERDKTQLLWDREREAWETDRRNLERKVHVVEGRLKAVLNEIAAAQEAGTFNAAPKGENGELDKGGTIQRESDSASIHSRGQGLRRTSVASMSTDDGEFRNARCSVVSITNGQAIKNDSLNLADELAFDEEEEFVALEEDATPDSPETLPEERPMSVNSQVSSTIGVGMKARKVLGLSLHENGGVDNWAQGLSSPVQAQLGTRVKYRDTGTQYSPRLSPKSPAYPEYIQSVDDYSHKSPPPHSQFQAGRGHSTDADSTTPRTRDSSTLTVSVDMISTSSQTTADLLSPLMPKSAKSPPESVIASDKVVMTSVSTQTQGADGADEKSPRTPRNNASELAIPMIAIHPPCSEPPSPRTSVVLPPQTKSVSCQTNFRSVVEGRSIAIQTEEIRIDRRPVKLPASLLPSAIPDLPLGHGAQDRAIQPYHIPPPRLGQGVRNTRQRTIEAPSMPSKENVPEHKQAYPGNNDNGPLSEDFKSGIRRPLRSSSLFAGFEEMSDEESQSPKSRKDVFTDDELLNRPFASYTLRRGRLVSAQNRPGLEEITLPEIDEHLAECDSKVHEEPDGDDGREHIGISQGGQHPGGATSGNRQQDIRKAAIVSSGAAAHQKSRSRSPSEPSVDSFGSGIAPPFPVPIRYSSRKFPLNGSEGQRSPTPSGARNFSDRTHHSIVRRPTLRRVRSAAAMSQADQPERTESGSSRAMSNSSYTPDSPQRPPLPFDDIMVPREKRAGKKRPSYVPRTLAHERHDSAATAIQQTSVVDAIAQTMVGEWMLKYIRRRKSFGVNESQGSWDSRNVEEMSAGITNSGVRHKRWVWLAPYERAIMWSSKQPTSSPALLGKSGRKFVIKSVLDVKDDNPMPKGFHPSSQFNRSILVLTPQRALKFTTTSIERHYVWLTALSFLSHSSMGLNDLTSLPPVPQEEYPPRVPTAALRKNPIRDSIKVAKGRPRPIPRAKRSFTDQPPVPELPASGVGMADPLMDAADPPNVPRFSRHARKRSNTTTRIPALRSLSSNGTMPSSHSGTTAGSSDVNHPVWGMNYGYGSGRSSFSRRMSEASGPSSVGTGNFFDAIGTVRMELSLTAQT